MRCGKQFTELFIGFAVMLHSLDKQLFGFGNGFDGRRNDIVKVVLGHITLALDAERRDTVSGDLCKQRARNALDGKGKRHVLHRAFMA